MWTEKTKKIFKKIRESEIANAIKRARESAKYDDFEKRLVHDRPKPIGNPPDYRPGNRDNNEWISVKERLPTGGEDEAQVQAAYLAPSFGLLSLEQTVAYYDDPDDYEDGNGKGWLTWIGDKEILVTHWKPLSPLPKTEFHGISQKDFAELFGNFRPNLGSVYVSKKSTIYTRTKAKRNRRLK
ncbi:MAG: DUF551 domain-containing protein [Candidatus Zixiibacteriota bacterium]|nr:MAG: DUF551 domain-containing protein [candidate division Zixibacteria bacterium]